MGMDWRPAWTTSEGFYPAALGTFVPISGKNNQPSRWKELLTSMDPQAFSAGIPTTGNKCGEFWQLAFETIRLQRCHNSSQLSDTSLNPGCDRDETIQVDARGSNRN